MLPSKFNDASVKMVNAVSPIEYGGVVGKLAGFGTFTKQLPGANPRVKSSGIIVGGGVHCEYAILMAMQWNKNITIECFKFLNDCITKFI